MITGLLSAVGSLSVTLQDSTISLNWTAPFTLDIRGVDPDITYCVAVVNSTSSTPHSQCGINVTEYEYPIPPDSTCHNYTFTFIVTPVNAVGNGISTNHHLQGEHAPMLSSYNCLIMYKTNGHNSKLLFLLSCISRCT